MPVTLRRWCVTRSENLSLESRCITSRQRKSVRHNPRHHDVWLPLDLLTNYVEKNPLQRVIHFSVYYIREALPCFLFRIWLISLFLRAVVNIPIQALIISQELELGPPVHAHTLISNMRNTKFYMWRAASQINHVIPIPWEDFEFSLFVTLEMIPKTPFVNFFFFTEFVGHEKRSSNL